MSQDGGRDESAMNSIVQRVARQALTTFRESNNGGSRCFPEQLSKLQALLSEVKASDLDLAPPRGDSPSYTVGGIRPPVTYMHICETEAFSMGVFLLRRGACIPLHDHPGMHGLLRVLYGRVRIACFDRMDGVGAASSVSSSLPPQTDPEGSPLLRAVLRTVVEYTGDSGVCALSPHRDNLHQIEAIDGPVAFMDILAPPYDPDEGRDCHYYQQVVPTEEQQRGARVGDEGASRTESPPEHVSEVWLLKVPQPPDFWCGSEPYPGPSVYL